MRATLAGRRFPVRSRIVLLIAVLTGSAVLTSALPAVAAPARAAHPGRAALPSAATRTAPGPAHGPAAVPHSRLGTVKSRSAFGPAAVVPSGDEVITASADTGGYHLFAASSGGGWRWQPLATLQPGGYRGEQWIGAQCLTGDGRYVVAVAAPWSAQNSAAGMAAGGIAYVIDAHTGQTRPLAAGVAVTYFNPGCGVGDSATLTSYTADESHTRILLADLSSGAVHALPLISGELTSAVPASGQQVLAARGRQLVAVSGAGEHVVASLHGQVFSLRPDAAGGADFLAQTAPAGADPAVGAFSWSPPGLRELGQGTMHELRLYAGADGRNILLGAAAGPRPAPGAAVTWIPASGPAGTAMSARGEVMLRGAAALVNPADGSPVSSPAAALPAAARPVTSLPAAQAPAAATARAAALVRPDSPADGGTATPTCAVPRLSDSYQVPQPSSAQIEWASTLGGGGRLFGSGSGTLRPDGFDNLAGSGWDPSSDFPLPLNFGIGRSFVPKEILDGVMAQESNWHQASPHAPQGVSGDPYIADYYGYNSAGTVDYSRADCGYGLGQITDGMRLGSGQTTPTPLQQRVAVDYAENVAAAAKTLASKWNFLTDNGVTIDGGDPSLIEDWYFAVWAYNSGVNPQQSTGNTTNCIPGTGCTDSAGNWGLGWTNNPANPVYDPARGTFLHSCAPARGQEVCRERFQDAASPQGWPYQEKVFGWIETPQTESDGSTPRYPGTFDYATQSGYFLNQPSHGQMCDSSDHCDYSQAQPCAYSSSADPLQWHCWWHNPVTGVCTASSPCHPGHTASASTAEPAVSDPFPATCSNSLPAGTVLIDDGSVSGTTTGQNLAGCPQSAQSNGGSFSWLPNFDTSLEPVGLVDLHQLGTGYGGHLLFTHLEDPSNKQWGGTAEWNLSADYDVYDVSVFVPGLAAAGTLSYTVYDGRGNQVGGPIAVNQGNYTNQWVDLGQFFLGPGSKVTTTNVVPGGDGATDVAFDAVAFIPVPSYAAIGDSYSSGVGVGSANYDPATDTSSNQCLRSADSYARKYGAAHGYPGVLTVHLACAGAVIGNLTTAGQYSEPAQISAIPRHARLVTVTIGGNDAGFEGVLTHCLTPGNACEADYATGNNNTDPAKGLVNEDYLINNLEAQLENAYNRIRARAPTATIIAVTYPSIFQPTTTQRSCLFQTVLGLSAQDIEWLISETNYLDNQIEIAARRAGIQALDERYAFAGHEVCAGTPWVNGALSGVPEAFHPTIDGYTQEATDLAAAVANPALLVRPYKSLRDPRPGTPSAAVALNLLSSFPRGRATYNGAGYSRSMFNQNGGTVGWVTWPAAYGFCQTRDLVLHRDDDAPSPPSGLCDLTGGIWNTPYEAVLTPTSNQSSPVDHVVPLKDAWANGASGWTQGLRVDFANDLRGLQLITVSNSSNSSKMDFSIEQWQPPNTGYWCAYAEMWVAIKYQYNLAIDGVLVQKPATTDEWDWLSNELSSCAAAGH